MKQTEGGEDNTFLRVGSTRELNGPECDYISLRSNQSGSTGRRLLHPDVVAPIYSIHTLPTDEDWITDMTSVTGVSTSPPSSSLVPIPSTVAGRHEIETLHSSSVRSPTPTVVPDDHSKPIIQSALAIGLQEDADILRHQIELMREQMETVQTRLIDLTKETNSVKPVSP